MMRRVIVLLGFLCTVLSAPAFAKAPCTCAESDLTLRAERADVIFTGRVDTIETQSDFIKPYVADTPVKITLNISTPIKGLQNEKAFTLMTSLTRDTCTGHPFIEDENYLVFAYQRKDGTFESWSLYNFSNGTYDVGGLCGGTKKLSDAKNDLNQLKTMDFSEKKSRFDLFSKTPEKGN